MCEKVYALVDKIRSVKPTIICRDTRYLTTTQQLPFFIMTLFNQSKGQPRAKNLRTRGQGNRALRRGRGGRGGRGDRLGQTNRAKKASFKSTRTDEKSRSDSEQSEQASESDAELESNLNGPSSDEEDATAGGFAVKPYSALLQSLSDTTQHEQPQRKKRKKSEFEVSGKIDAVQDVDLVVEPEEAEDLGIGELTDDDRDDEAEKGLFYHIF